MVQQSYTENLSLLFTIFRRREHVRSNYNELVFKTITTRSWFMFKLRGDVPVLAGSWCLQLGVAGGQSGGRLPAAEAFDHRLGRHRAGAQLGRQFQSQWVGISFPLKCMFDRILARPPPCNSLPPIVSCKTNLRLFLVRLNKGQSEEHVSKLIRQISVGRLRTKRLLSYCVQFAYPTFWG